MREIFATRRLFSRVFLHGFLVLSATAIAFVVLAALVAVPEIDRNVLNQSKWAAPALCEYLAGIKARPAGAENLNAAVYAESGRLIGSLASPPTTTPLSAEQLGQLRRTGSLAIGRPATHAVRCAGVPDGAYLVVGPPMPPPLSAQFAVLIVLVVTIVTLASIPFARSIVRPIDELARASHAFGRGDLGARTDIDRRDEVGDLARAFNEMASRLQQLIKGEKELLANLSHELRTPLARIRVVLETAQEHPKRAEFLLTEIGADLGDLERLVETVMEAMRIDLGGLASSRAQLPLRPELIDLRQAVLDAVARFLRAHPERNAPCVQLEDSVSLIQVDPLLFRRLLDNLPGESRF